MKMFKKVLVTTLIILVACTSLVLGYSYYKLSKIKTVPISKTDKDLGIKAIVSAGTKANESVVAKTDEITVAQDKDIVNIALFGLDRRDKTEPSRSDSIMILTIDKLHKKIKLSSIMRDTYVEVSGHDKTKITHAFAYGGAQLAVRTLNENFNLNIRDYASVDFFEFEKIIDSLGGVTIDVKSDEVSLINDKVQEIAYIENSSYDKITKTGIQVLNGKQAVAYSRVRYTAGGDFVRTDRQRTVLSALLTKIQSSGKASYPSVVSKLLPFTETSMGSLDIVKLGLSIFTSNISTIQQERFPVDGYCIGKMIDGVWYLSADLKATTDQLHKYIYEDIKPTPLAPLF